MTYSLLRNRSASELLSIAFVGAGLSDRYDCSITPLRGKRVQGFRMAGATDQNSIVVVALETLICVSNSLSMTSMRS